MAEYNLTFERGIPFNCFEDYLERHARSLVGPPPGVPHLPERPVGRRAEQPAAVVSHGMSIVPKRILLSGDRTIVFWADGTKTIVKRAEGEPDSVYAAFTAAFAIKLFGSNSAVKKIIEKKTEYQLPKTNGVVQLEKACGPFDLSESISEKVRRLREFFGGESK